MTARRRALGRALEAAIGMALSLAPLHGANGQIVADNDGSDEQQAVDDGQQANTPIGLLANRATIAGSQEGQRLSGDIGILRSPAARVSNRVRNRVETRLRTRIDQNFAAPTDNLDQFRRAADAASEEVSQEGDGEPEA